LRRSGRESAIRATRPSLEQVTDGVAIGQIPRERAMISFMISFVPP
jgi:hypothetical protein